MASPVAARAPRVELEFWPLEGWDMMPPPRCGRLTGQVCCRRGIMLNGLTAVWSLPRLAKTLAHTCTCTIPFSLPSCYVCDCFQFTDEEAEPPDRSGSNSLENSPEARPLLCLPFG